MQTVRMIRDDGKTADVHPAEVENWKRGGWRVVEKQPEPVRADAPKRRKAKG